MLVRCINGSFVRGSETFEFSNGNGSYVKVNVGDEIPSYVDLWQLIAKNYDYDWSTEKESSNFIRILSSKRKNTGLYHLETIICPPDNICFVGEECKGSASKLVHDFYKDAHVYMYSNELLISERRKGIVDLYCIDINKPIISISKDDLLAGRYDKVKVHQDTVDEYGRLFNKNANPFDSNKLLVGMVKAQRMAEGMHKLIKLAASYGNVGEGFNLSGIKLRVFTDDPVDFESWDRKHYSQIVPSSIKNTHIGICCPYDGMTYDFDWNNENNGQVVVFYLNSR